MAGQPEQITVLIHGTYANLEPEQPGDAEPARWWRLTEGGLGGTTADKLQAALEERDDSLAGTVWREGEQRDAGMGYDGFVEWSSKNTHRARMRAAKNLAGSLETLAEDRGCTPERPLQVNYVAHSHGGNIVLESLNHLPRNGRVQPRQISMLGTPLTWRYPDMRIAYFGIIVALLALSSSVLADVDGTRSERLGIEGGLPLEILWTTLFLSGTFWLVFALISSIRFVAYRAFPGKPTYGPTPDDLETILEGRPAVLFINPEDEADLMMHLGAAPLDAYRAVLSGRRTSRRKNSWWRNVLLLPLTFIEIVLVRPFAYVILVPLFEIALERFGLGFPLRLVMIRNHEMMTWTNSWDEGESPYARPVLRRQLDPDELRRPPRRAVVSPRREPEGNDTSAPPKGHTEQRVDAVQARFDRELTRLFKWLRERRGAEAAWYDRRPDRARIEELRTTLEETFDGLKEQVHLSHAGYYEAEIVIEEVAAVIAASDGLDVLRIVDASAPDSSDSTALV